jgi:hypothetical protein
LGSREGLHHEAGKVLSQDNTNDDSSLLFIGYMKEAELFTGIPSHRIKATLEVEFSLFRHESQNYCCFLRLGKAKPKLTQN